MGAQTGHPAAGIDWVGYDGGWLRVNILVCTLGSSWPVIPEAFGFIAPQRLDLYAHHPNVGEIDRMRSRLAEPDELWVCTTEGVQTVQSVEKLLEWWRLLGQPIPMRLFVAAGADQLASQYECNHFRELVLRVVLSAVERCSGSGQVVLSLAGGRKTMSADLQSAGQTFGACAWLHIVGPEPLPAEISRAATPELFTAALPPSLAAAVTPLIVGRGTRNELLDIEIDGRRVCASAFPLPLPRAGVPNAWALPAEGATLTRELERRERESSRLLGNYLSSLGHAEHFENWRSLYRLPPHAIERLRHTLLSPAHADWLTTTPKADLHRHLGGCLDLNAQQTIGRAVWGALSSAERNLAREAVRPLIDDDRWPWDWPQRYCGKNLDQQTRSARCAALLVECAEHTLYRNLYEVTEPRLALKAGTRGFSAYERPGELTGSAILGHPAAIVPYAHALVGQIQGEGVAYAELRGSPHKYRPNDPAGFLSELRQAFEQAGADTGLGIGKGPRLAFIWILDRRQRASIGVNVAQAVAARENLDGFLVGLDLAGDEGTQRPDEIAPLFESAFRDCLRITIHAGEGEPADNIWQATYHLHADRIGHGLTLADNPRLRERFRDRGICLELCPTSNREVVGFADPEIESSRGLPLYPLRALFDAGLPVTLCTDNPGISRTTLSNEYLVAGRMCQDGLSQWEALALIRQGFRSAFVSASERERMVTQADARIYSMLCTTSLPDPATQDDVA